MKVLKSSHLVTIGLCVLFFLTRLSLLTKLPVFADEAIYIRWAQVGQNEPDKYLFLSMLDGKPPLHNWMIAGMLKIIVDPLLASRLISVIFGAGTIFYLHFLILVMSSSRKNAYIGSLLAVISPFFLINQRMGLAESMLTFFFTAGLFHGYKTQTNASNSRQRYLHGLVFGLTWGLALWTKTNALFFALPYALIPLLKPAPGVKNLIVKAWPLIMGGIFGGALFASLKFSPLFPSLFSRSQDYTFTMAEIFNGQWRHVVFNTLPKITGWISWYTMPSLIVLVFFAFKKNRILLAMVCAYCLPLILFGKILSARYFFPIAPLVICMIVNGLIAAQQFEWQRKISVALMGISVVWAAVFSAVHILEPDNTWYVADDRRQYLEDWSSGHGISQVRDLIRARLKDHQVTVATEGYFGTLPDGLMMYFDNRPEIKNLELYGIGQPISALPANLYEKAKEREVYIVVNQHRFTMPLSPMLQKVGEYSRPNNAPSLLLLKVNVQ